MNTVANNAEKASSSTSTSRGRRLLIANMGSWRNWQKGEGTNRNYHVLNEIRRRGLFEEIIAVDVLPHDYTSGLREQFDLLFKQYRGAERGGGLLARMTKVEEDLLILELPVAGIQGLKAGENTLKKMVEKRWPEGPDVVWSYTPFLSRLPELFPEAHTVFDAVDEWREHQAYQNRREELSEHYERIATTFDTVFTVSKAVQQELFSDHSNATWVPNGIDADHFAPFDVSRWDKEDREGFTRAKKTSDLPQPVIGYVGVIENRVDAELISAVADAFSGGSIVLVGPSWRKDGAWKQLIARNNVHVYGAVPYSSAPWVSSQFDVALIPHKVNKFTQSMNPMKLYEYLSMGLPVVSTPVAGLHGFEQGIRVANTTEEFVGAVREAVQDITPKSERRKLVQGHSWQDRLDTMLNKMPRNV